MRRHRRRRRRRRNVIIISVTLIPTLLPPSIRMTSLRQTWGQWSGSDPVFTQLLNTDLESVLCLLHIRRGPASSHKHCAVLLRPFTSQHARVMHVGLMSAQWACLEIRIIICWSYKDFSAEVINPNPYRLYYSSITSINIDCLYRWCVSIIWNHMGQT